MTVPGITITLPDTPAMRSLLRDLAAHVIDDELPEAEEPSTEGAARDVDRAAACHLFDVCVTAALEGQSWRDRLPGSERARVVCENAAQMVRSMHAAVRRDIVAATEATAPASEKEPSDG